MGYIQGVAPPGHVGIPPNFPGPPSLKGGAEIIPGQSCHMGGAEDEVGF